MTETTYNYSRTENNVECTVNLRAGRDEINEAMTTGRKLVKEMSQITRTDFSILYKDGRKVTLRLTEAPAAIEPATATMATVNKDTLVRVSAERAIATLSTGRTYLVNLKVNRKADHGTWRVVRDCTEYFSERDGSPFGSTRAAGDGDKPGSVGGRIWALLKAANVI